MLDCLFCKIADGEILAEIVAENNHALAFRDINPQASTHVLVIPREHISSTSELNEENVYLLSQMALLANEVAIADGIVDSGYRWVINTGNHGGQTVFHIHLHLLGGRQLNWPPG